MMIFNLEQKIDAVNKISDKTWKRKSHCEIIRGGSWSCLHVD